MNLHLYTIKSEWEKALYELSQIEGLTDEIIKDSCSLVQFDFEERALQIMAYVKNIEAEAKAMKDYEDNMKSKRQRLEKTADMLTAHVKNAFVEMGLSSAKNTELSIKVSKGGYAIDTIDRNLVDNKYKCIRQEEIIDKEAIKKDWEANGKSGVFPGIAIREVHRMAVK